MRDKLLEKVNLIEKAREFGLSGIKARTGRVRQSHVHSILSIYDVKRVNPVRFITRCSIYIFPLNIKKAYPEDCVGETADAKEESRANSSCSWWEPAIQLYTPQKIYPIAKPKKEILQ